ncbi:hypothetical protein [Flammeovirga sp. SubArs3]|uniref:hypothetical protein n=1 Tax=Flammeovirga sp. SubArs3 TaxID=2995316 RepID=UPI00248A966E|nr:hypothetical protein [Flammeovirga sp. SubArs3]
MEKIQQNTKTELLTTDFWSVYRLDSWYFIQWKDAGSEMNDEEFMDHISSFAKLVETDGVNNRISGFVVDTRAYHYVMNLDVQKWHDDVIVPKYIASGITKIAFCLSGDLIRDLSIEQTFDEDKAQSGEIQIQYFQELRKATAWVEGWK